MSEQEYNPTAGELDPPPDLIDLETGNKMWIIKDYKIWAPNYQEALSILPLIEQSCTQSYSDY